MAPSQDERLAADVGRALGHDPQVGLTNVRVQVLDGRLILTGMVETPAQREEAGRAAARIIAQMGSRLRIENDLTVASPREDSDRKLEQALDAVLAAVPDLPPEAVGARVEGGVAFLVGHATSAGQIEAALAAARRVPGLKDVVSQVQIVTGAPPDAADLVSRVAEALGLDTRVNGREIEVAADPEGTVTLRGEVASRAEREIAEQVAASVTGVHRVVNRIRAREM